MANVPQKRLPCLVKADVGAGLVELGYTLDGVSWSIQPYYHDIHSDRKSTAGPVIERQLMGQTVSGRLEFTEWDSTNLLAFAAMVAGGTLGTEPTSGVFMFNESLTFRLLLLTANRPTNFLRVVISDAEEFQSRLKAEQPIIPFTAYDAGSKVIYNATTS